MSSIAWFDSAFSLRLTTVFLHFLWQGCLIGAIVFAGNALLRRVSAKRSYLFNLAALGTLAACVPVTFLSVKVSVGSPETTVVTPKTGGKAWVANDPSLVIAERFSATTDLESKFDSNATAAHVPIGDSSESSSTADEPAAALKIANLGAISPYFVMMYVVGVCLMLSRLATGIWGGHRLRKATSQIEDPAILATLARQVERFGIRFLPAIAWCEQVTVPVVVGIVKPMILLPATMTSGLTPDQLQALLTHELAHIRRFDLLANLFQRLAESLLFFHPVVWYVSRRVSIEREHAADDMVLEAGWHKTQYADALVRMAELSVALRQTKSARRAVSLAASGTNSSEFKRRILRLLDISDTPRLSLTRGGLLLTLFVACALATTPAIVKSWADDPQTQPDVPEIESDETSPRDLELIERIESQRLRQEGSTAISFTHPAENEPSSEFDKSKLPRVSRNFTLATRVDSHLVTGGGIIERIEENTIHFQSGDRVEFQKTTPVLLLKEEKKTIRFLRDPVLEPGMVVSYELQDGTIKKLVLLGIVEEENASVSVFDTIKQLKLELGNETSTSLDGRFPMRLMGKSGEVQIKQGETKLIELAKPTTLVEWQVGEYKPEGVDDIEPFDYLLVQWRENGRVTWTCYRSNPTRDFEPARPEPVRPEDSEARNTQSPLIIRSASEFSKRLAEVSEKYEYSTRLQKKGYVTALQVEHERKQRDILREELATQIRLLELETENAARGAELAKADLARLKQLAKKGIVTQSELQLSEVKSANAVLQLEKIKQLLELYRKVRNTYVPQDDASKPAPAEAASHELPRYSIPTGDASGSPFPPGDPNGTLTQQNPVLTLQIKQINEIEKAIDTEFGEANETLLREALKRYEDLYKKYRAESVGLWARFYQGRCLWRLGQTDEAEMIFKELTDLPESSAAMSKLRRDMRQRISELRDSGKTP